MTVIVSVAVQAHPVRAEMAERLSSRIGGADTSVVWDPEPDSRPSAWRTYREALERTPASATHRIVIQDDSEVCDGFMAAATAAIEARPDRLVCFYVGGNPAEHAREVLRACERDESWAQLDHLRWIPAIALGWPVGLVEPILEFVDAQKWPDTFTADDEIIGRFMRSRRESPLATVPSLVQHPDIVPSIVSRRDRQGLDPGRLAACWVGYCEGFDVAAIDWTTGA